MKLKQNEIFTLHAEFCKILANPKRLMILAVLSQKEANVGEIAAAIGATMPNVSQHLNILKSRNIVRTRKEGQNIYYRLYDERITEACNLIRSVLIDTMKSRGLIAAGINLKTLITMK